MGICGALPDIYAGVMHGYNDYDTHNLALLTTEKSDTRQWEKPHFFMGDFTIIKLKKELYLILHVVKFVKVNNDQNVSSWQYLIILQGNT
ncbi:MAG: hypothetical protein RIR90_939 [Bacteroidota bacterium]|jgi:hypothetical protein